MDIKPSDMIVDHEQQQFGVFLSDTEKAHKTWNLQLENPGYHFRQKHFILQQNDLLRLRPGASLNDEVVNGYIGLLNKVAQADTILLYSRFWPHVTNESHEADNIRLQGIALNQVRYVLYSIW